METATENFDKEDGDAISNFVQVLSDVALDALPIRPKKKKPWFEENKDTLIPLQKARNLAHTEWKKTKTGLDRKIFNDARGKFKKAVKDAKEAWAQRQIDSVHNIKDKPYAAWQAIDTLVGGLTGHHKSPKEMRDMLFPDGSIAKTDEDIAKACQMYFEHEVFSRHSEYDSEAVENLEQRPIDDDLGAPFTMEEFLKAIYRMKERKAPGKNGLPIEAFKALNSSLLQLLYDILLPFWTDMKCDPEAWHDVILRLIPKKKDLNQPKNWRPICLIDVLMKIISSIIATRLDDYLVNKIGLPEQNGFSTARGCSDGTTSVKIALQNLKAADQDA